MYKGRKGNVFFSALFLFILIIMFLFVAVIDLPIIVPEKKVRLDTNTSQSGTNVDANSSFAFNHSSRPVARNRILVVGVQTEPQGSQPRNVTYGNIPLDLVVNASHSVESSIWVLRDVESGTNLVNASNFTGPVNVIVMGAMTFNGVSPSNPFYSAVNNTGTGEFPTIPLSPREEEDVIVDSLATNSDTVPNPISDQTEVWNIHDAQASNDLTGSGSFLRTKGNETAISWKATNDEINWAHTAIILEGKIINEESEDLELLLRSFQNVVVPVLILLLFFIALIGMVVRGI